MKEKTKKYDVGVIVGRFQTHELTEGHKSLINHVLENHDTCLIILGNSPLRNTLNNPLDFQCRRVMINEEYPDIDIGYVHDHSSDEYWSTQLDLVIHQHLNTQQTAVLYGSRDSFIKHYHGRHDTIELEADIQTSATALRRQVCNKYPRTKDYRAGMIAATANRFPTCYMCVDLAVIGHDGRLLLGRKPGETQWRFFGGFLDPARRGMEGKGSLEENAIREGKEEASKDMSIELSPPVYIGSTGIDNWRYRGEPDSIMTALFASKLIFGKPEANDDIEAIRWVDLNDLPRTELVPEHRVLLDKFTEWLAKGNTL